MLHYRWRSSWHSILEENQVSDGISFIVCCHNSARRLPPTLAHLAAQTIPLGLSWEVVLVDNASTDNTVGVACKEWPEHLEEVLRVVHEPKAGLGHARRRGWENARFGVLSFVDDDNWVCTEWARLAVELMKLHPGVGVCGGQIEAVCEADPPVWFERFNSAYAVGKQAEEAGDITESRGYVWGAGLTLRKEALVQLINGGFQPSLTGRKGTGLTAGEDSELCFALRQAGWKIWYDPRLTLRHFLPATRLNWNYLRRLHRGFGASKVALKPYRAAWCPDQARGPGRPTRSWLLEVGHSIASLLKKNRKALVRFWSSQEGDGSILQTEHRLGFLFEMLAQRGRYDQAIQRVKNKR